MKKENKYVIVRTRIGNTSECYSFATIDYKRCITPQIPSFMGSDKFSDSIEVVKYVGGDLRIDLKTKTSGDYEINEQVFFPKDIITAVEVHTEFNKISKLLGKDK